MSRVLVIGIDGLGLRYLIEHRNRLDTLYLYDLINRGVYGELISVLPLLTPPNWLSAYTGVNPGKHGVYDFVKIDRDYSRRLISSRDRGAPAIWNILTMKNIPSIVFNVPATHPPEKIKGVMVTDAFTDSDKIYTYPYEFGKILRRVGYYRESVAGYTLDNYIEKTLDMVDAAGEGASYLLENIDWRLAIIVFTMYDGAMHRFYSIEDRDVPEYIKSEVKDYPVKILRRIDKWVKRLLQYIDNNDHLIIHSDHGFHKLYYEVYVNAILNKYGLLSYRRRRFKLPKDSIVVRRLVKLLWNRISGDTRIKLARYVGSKPSYDDIIWEKTYAAQTIKLVGKIIINSEGKYSRGIVNKEEYQTIRDKVVNILKMFKIDGRNVFIHVYKSDEIFYGPYVEKAPDIVFTAREGYAISDEIDKPYIKRLKTNIDWNTPVKIITRIGAHNLRGFYLVKGPNVRQGTRIDGINIVDITPYILYFLDLPIYSYMDGIINKEIFKEEPKIEVKKMPLIRRLSLFKRL